MLRLLASLVLSFGIAASAAARELADAPEVRIIGFSGDGRYFAYEQFIDDAVSDAAASAIDVIDRRTGKSEDGFPLGFLLISQGGGFPAKVGRHDVKQDETLSGAARLAALRRSVRAAAQRQLERLGIADNARRLAGRPPTERPRTTGPVSFVLGATLEGGVPDLQPVYTLAARVEPKDLSRCVDGRRAPEHRVVLTLSRRDGAGKAVAARKDVTVGWPKSDDDCPSTALVTDVVAHGPASGEPTPDEAQVVAVLVLATAWAPHAESGRYLAAFVELP
jgi:hypothetical protein